MSQHQGDRTIESHSVVQLILKHVQVVQSIRIAIARGGEDSETLVPSIFHKHNGLTWWL